MALGLKRIKSIRQIYCHMHARTGHHSPQVQEMMQRQMHHHAAVAVAVDSGYGAHNNSSSTLKGRRQAPLPALPSQPLPVACLRCC
jgi:hypothetical protein